MYQWSWILDIDDPADLINAEFTPEALEDQIVTYLEDNLIETSGIHAQLGLRFKVLVADAHLNFRYNITEDVYKAKIVLLRFSLNLVSVFS